ncbi:DUF5915 domain-containing protein [Candidatus Gracilibacteria bacterium]|nr:DUF5915 domain-containing protein [Candidatus Gracilibacteria bacterium]
MIKTTKELLEKYGDIIKEEINIKEISLLPDSLQITKIYKPIGSQISSKFTKDTGKIIQFSKQGNIQELENGQIKVFDDQKNERILEKEDYEIAYQGIDGDNIAIDGNMIAKLNLEITPQLQKEGIAREISRFLNQMRKEADYKVDTKVTMSYHTTDQYLDEIVLEFSEFLIGEALLKEIKKEENIQGDISSIFTIDQSTINFTLQK